MYELCPLRNGWRGMGGGTVAREKGGAGGIQVVGEEGAESGIIPR